MPGGRPGPSRLKPLKQNDRDDEERVREEGSRPKEREPRKGQHLHEEGVEGEERQVSDACGGVPEVSARGDGAIPTRVEPGERRSLCGGHRIPARLEGRFECALTAVGGS